MWLMVEPTQRVHFRGIKDDAVKMWGVLEGVHMQKQPGTRFNAYDDLFSIQKRDEEDLQSLTTQPLELVHSDLHGPLPVATREGYRYWMTFIDDATSHRAAMQLKQKSNAFDAFKTYKAFAENHFQQKMKEFQDDKGGVQGIYQIHR